MKMGWQDAPLVEAVPKGSTKAQPKWASAPLVNQNPEPADDEDSLLKRIGAATLRQLGLGARDLIQIAASPFALATDLVAAPINAVAGRELIEPAAQALDARLTMSGLPEPVNATERITSRVNRAVGSAGFSVAGGAQMAQQAASPVVRNVGQVLASRPGTQVAGAVGAATGGGVAHEAGAGPGVELAASLAGGVVGASGFELAKAAGRGAKAVVQPFTQAGQERIVGDILDDAAVAPGNARQNLQNVEEIVPGSPSTTGPASKDLGLLSLERRTRNTSPADFAETTSQQNSARQEYLESAAKTPQALKNAIERRDAVTKPIREASFKAAQGKSVDFGSILKKIDELIADPDNAGEATQSALLKFRKAVDGKTDARALYAVRKDINRVLDGKFVDSEESALRYAGGQLKSVRRFIDDAIGDVAPPWKSYLTKYAQLSRPIDRMTLLQQKADAVVTAPTDVSGKRFISQAKWFQQITRDMPELEQELTKGQLEKLRRIGADLDRGELINSKAVKPFGSDTANNLTVGNLVGAIRGRRGEVGPISGTLARPFQWLSKFTEPQVQALLVKAIKTPELAARLLGKATPNNAAATSTKLKELAVAMGLGTTQGTLNTPAPETPSPPAQ